MTAANKLRELSDDELVTRLGESKAEAFNLRFQHVTGQLDNTSRLGDLHGRDVARINTLLHQRDRPRGRGPRSPGEVMADETTPEARASRKLREGTAVSTSMDKTVIVAVIERVRHPRYTKTVQRTKRLYAHDEANDVNVGDRVHVMETRPLSKQKRWRVVEVLERAK